MNPELRSKYGTAQFPGVNLIPKEIAEKKALQRVRLLAVVAIVISIAVVIVGYFGAVAVKTIAQSDLNSALADQTAAVNERDGKVDVYTEYLRLESEEYALTQVGFGEMDYAQLTSAVAGTANAETSYELIYIQGPNAEGFGAPLDDPIFGVGGVGTLQFIAHATSVEEASALVQRLEEVPGIANVTAVSEEFVDENGNLSWKVSGQGIITKLRLMQRLLPTDGVSDIDASETVRLQDPNEEPLPAASASPSASPSDAAAAADEGN
ncbi:hypothetical protein [Demequina aurantiaca]|uniref:hypothetical protein n=1 Tax=Demequina aurantiaca TaxID=676200 RepID=UPI003D340D2E